MPTRSQRLLVHAACVFALLWAIRGAAADLLVQNATVIAVQPARVTGVRNVLIRDGRIVAISERPISGVATASIIDGRGRFLVPGIMDSHVHVSATAGIPVAAGDLDLAALRAQYFRQQPRSYLYFGVTQLLDPTNSSEGVAVFNTQPQRPDLFRCGTVLWSGDPTSEDSQVRESLRSTTIYELADAAHPLPPGEVAAEHTPEAVVAKIGATAARCVNLQFPEGDGIEQRQRSDRSSMSADILQRVVNAAHSRHLLVLAHANALGMQRQAVNAGVDVLAQGLWNWDGLNARTGLPPSIADHLRNVREKRVGLQSTLRGLYSKADLFRQDTLLDPTYAKVVPPPVLAWYRTDAGQWFRRNLKSEYNNAPDMKLMQLHFIAGERGMRVLRNMADAGYPLLLGSDTPSSPTYGSQPGYDTYREIRAMAQSGVPLAAILQAATINNARQFRLEHDYGSVEVGKVANLLLLNANPLESVRAWSQIDKVILHGVAIDRDSLAADR